MAQLTEFGCLKKLIAQTYDGAAVMSGELNGVQAKVKDSAPDAIFIHCLAHKPCIISSSFTHSKMQYIFFNPWRTIVILYIIVKKDCSAG